jgi:hypothetical protein
VSHSVMSPLERKAALKAAVTLQEITCATAARRLGISYNHLMLVLSGERHGSGRLRRAIADLFGKGEEEVFGPAN